MEHIIERTLTDEEVILWVYITTAIMASGQGQDEVHVTKPHEGITVITIDRAHRRNAVDANTARKLFAAVTAFGDDDSQKVSRPTLEWMTDTSFATWVLQRCSAARRSA